MKWRGWVLGGCALLAAQPAAAACKVGKMLELPVTMAGRRPMVTAQFGGKDAHFIVDSGAFYSTLSRASAAEFGVQVRPAPPSFYVKGVGGTSSVGIGTTRDFKLGGVTLPKADFIVGGSDTGTAGLLGQNILGLADVEYDLPHGAVRLMRTTDCDKATLAYWAGERPFSTIRLEERDPISRFKPHTIATVLINGVKVRAEFDTGAQGSLLSLAAAKRIGVTPASPGVERSGETGGVGSRRIPTWRATFDSIDLAGERLFKPKITIADVDLGGADMLIGSDFFLTHRMFVSNAQGLMYFTYEGGPVFGLSPRGAVDTAGKRLDLTSTEPEPTTAEAFARRGAVLASNRRFDAALADFDKACELAPNEPRFFYQRAMAQLATRQPRRALADLDRVLKLDPTHVDARMMRASGRAAAKDEKGAIEDMAAADAALAPSSDKRLGVAAFWNGHGAPEKALANYDLWFRDHARDSSRAGAFNGRCWARAQLGRELDKALDDCNAAIRLRGQDGSYFDSRALVKLRSGDTAGALADYDMALKLSPKNAGSLYGRSLARRKLGRMQEADADRTAALALNADIAERAKKIGLE
ncbi:aspartyl protease family protein [Sphingomonas aracearum]|uniref:Peptidase A2 domain-containing protein n=1 Tax=Sphingomonas aracearum TaxID=2283317 RepID=A0A369VX75_9SPHN|nr:aspartyl protease family protein [Sphingomonas aracearum]RDE06984.1 hypothetical protein DVW87_04795 [Sphingomonas aracearum]